MTFEELVGQKLILGIDGAQATRPVLDLFRKTHAGGLILFRRNIETSEGVRRLISDLEEGLGRRLLILLDHEGGRVIHLGEGVTIFPDAEALGASGRIDWAKRQGEIEAEELGTAGIDINLAPVLDVLMEEWNPAIGTRSYGRYPELVAAMGRARIEGMQAKGLSACAKHYPGLGAARRDPHFELPSISKTWQALKQSDLRPFLAAFEAQVDCVMSSHPVYPELDPKRLPATFSRRIIHDTLRLEFGFRGAILTDDLKMGAVSKNVSLREGVRLAAQAGHDLLLLCSDPRSQEEAFDALLWAYKKRDLKTSELEESVERISRLRSKRAERFSKETPSLQGEGRALAQKIARAGAKVLNTGLGFLPLSPAACLRHSLWALFPDLTPVTARLFVERELLEPEGFLRETFSQFGIPLKLIEKISLDPPSGERERLKEKAREHDLILFFCADAHLFPGARELLKLLQETRRHLVVILLREPEDQEWVRPETPCVTGFGFRKCQIEAAVEKLFSPS